MFGGTPNGFYIAICNQEQLEAVCRTNFNNNSLPRSSLFETVQHQAISR